MQAAVQNPRLLPTKRQTSARAYVDSRATHFVGQHGEHRSLPATDGTNDAHKVAVVHAELDVGENGGGRLALDGSACRVRETCIVHDGTHFVIGSVSGVITSGRVYCLCPRCGMMEGMLRLFRRPHSMHLGPPAIHSERLDECCPARTGARAGRKRRQTV